MAKQHSNASNNAGQSDMQEHWQRERDETRKNVVKRLSTLDSVAPSNVNRPTALAKSCRNPVCDAISPR